MWIQEAAAKSLVENIRQTIKYKYPLTAEVTENLENLLTEVEKLQLLMKDFIDRDEILNYVREILDEAEDAVDSTYLLKANSSHLRSRLTSHVLPKSRDQVFKTGEKIKRICRKVNEFNARFSRTDAECPVQEIGKLRQAESSSRAPQVEEDRVIGFDGAAENLVALLTGGPECLEIISVAGVYGQGKTTLAKMVYTDPKVSNEYKIRAFVYVMRGSDKKRELVNILSELVNIPSDDNWIKGMTEIELTKHVYQQLKDKQYLVVLDSIYGMGEWYGLKDAFPNNRENRCRVLITTCDMDVVVETGMAHSHSLCRLKFLDEEESLELFRWRVFGENDCPVELREYEAKIVDKCTGLPLAIVAAAAMVVKYQKRVDGWNDVAKSMEHYNARDRAFYINTLIYKQLPNHLKPCFLYLATFPQDYEIPVWKVLRLWIAKGLIHDTGSFGYDDLEDIAEGYMDELVDHNLVMVSKRRANRKIRTCRMNSTIYQFCKEQSSREMLVPKINEYYRDSYLYTGSYRDQCRHICIDYIHTLDSLCTKPIKGMASRSFVFFSWEEDMVPPEKVSRIAKTFKYLKVLEVESLSFTQFPNRFCTLVLLKYLAISGSIKSLPETLFDLWNLQTLIVRTTCDALEIRANVWKMPNFRHLHTNVAASFPFLSTKCQKSEENENNVQTLCWISNGSCEKHVFDQTSKLQKLGIRGRLAELFGVNGGEASLFSCLHKLENLKLWNDENPINRLSGFPPKGAFPKQLTKLTLSHTRLDWKEMRTLGEMENLEILKLKEYAFVGNKWKTENNGFLRLKHLHIGHTDLMVWEASSDRFPILRSLEISRCDLLQRVPHTLADILSLQSVRLHSSTCPGVTYSLKRIRLVKFLQTKQADKRKIFEISVFPPQV